MRAIPTQARHQFGVFTAEQARAAGWTLSALKWAVSSGGLLRLRAGAYALPTEAAIATERDRVRLIQRAAAAALRITNGTISHSAAVAVHDLPLLGDLPAVPCITVPLGSAATAAGVHLHRGTVPPWQLSRHDLAVTSAARSCLQLSREAGLEAAVVAADAAVNRGLTDIEELRRVHSSLRGRGGLPLAPRIIAAVNGLSESPLETISRLAMPAHLPIPRLQVNLKSLAGRFLGRVDFYWEDPGVVGEADGRAKYGQGEAADQAWWKEKLRHERLEQAGVVVVRWNWADAQNPYRLHARIQDGFNRARLLRAAGVPLQVVAHSVRGKAA